MRKVVLLTGASSGIGKETAKILAQSNYMVYAAARRVEKLKDLESVGVKAVYLDVTDDHSMVKAVNQILETESRIDMLINNAGFGLYGAVEDVDIEAAKHQFEVNLFGATRLIQLVLPKMRENKYGKIVNISSGGGRFSTPYGGWYHSSKFALEGLSDSLRNEVKQFGIDVIVIEPGAVDSEFSGIAIESLLESSKGSVYFSTISRLAQSYQAMQKNNSKPLVISNLIKKAIESKKPKTRYAGGNGIKPALFLRWLLTDKAFDKMLQRQLKY